MAKNGLDKSAAARAVEEIRRRRQERLAAARARSIREIPKAPPKTATKAGAVLEKRHTREGGHGITYEKKAVLCGKKGCNKLHGPYWYAFWTAGGRVRSVYIGKKYRTVEEKCPERLKTPVDC